MLSLQLPQPSRLATSTRSTAKRYLPHGRKRLLLPFDQGLARQLPAPAHASVLTIDYSQYGGLPKVDFKKSINARTLPGRWRRSGNTA